MLKQIIFGLLIFTVSYSFSQDLTCADLLEGEFTVVVKKPVPIAYKITRKIDSQIERVTDIPKEYINSNIPKIVYTNVNWINECSYNLSYDETKLKLTDTQKEINNTGGILVEIERIKGRCFYYKSTMVYLKNELVINGEICKKE